MRFLRLIPFVCLFCSTFLFPMKRSLDQYLEKYFEMPKAGLKQLKKDDLLNLYVAVEGSAKIKSLEPKRKRTLLETLLFYAPNAGSNDNFRAFKKVVNNTDFIIDLRSIGWKRRDTRCMIELLKKIEKEKDREDCVKLLVKRKFLMEVEVQQHKLLGSPKEVNFPDGWL